MAYESKDYYWWKSSPEKFHEHIFPYVAFLNKDQSYKQLANYKHMRLYGNMDLSTQKLMNTQVNSIENRVTLNVVQSMVDTVTSKVTKNKPKPTFLTEGGDFSLQRKAKKLTQFAQGQFAATKFYQEQTKAFKDSCIFGTGAVKIFPQGSEIKVERTFIDELIIDDNEAIYGNPRQLHQIKFIHKDVLKDMFPDKTGVIDSCNPANQGMQRTFSANVHRHPDMIVVIESWHLKSGDEATDGMHCICIENSTLFNEPFKRDKFPFVFYRWNERPMGFFGQGLAEQLTGLQLEINKLLRTIQVSMHLVSIPKIFVEAGTKIVDSQINNKIGGIVTFAGQMPQSGALGQVPAELFSHLDRLYQRAFEMSGVSQLSAQAKKPSGLDSGKALREFNDIESERFMDVGMRYESACEEAAAIMIEINREIYEAHGDFDVKVSGREFLKTIKWSEVDLKDSKYVMQTFPTSFLSSTPAGKLQDVQELLQAGFISKEEGLQLLDFPDLSNFYSYQNAALKDIDNMIEQIIDSSDYNSPEPYQNLQVGVVRMQQAYLKYKSEGAPDSKLELFRRWIDDAHTLMQKASEPLDQAGPDMALQVPQGVAPNNMVQSPTGDIPVMPAPGVPVPQQ